MDDPYKPWLSQQRHRDPFQPWVTKQARDLDAWKGKKLFATLVGVALWFGAIGYQLHLGDDVLATGDANASPAAPAAFEYKGRTFWVTQAQATRWHVSEGLVILGALGLFGGLVYNQFVSRKQLKGLKSPE